MRWIPLYLSDMERTTIALDIAAMVYLFVTVCAFIDHLGHREDLFGRLFASELTDGYPGGWRTALLAAEGAFVILLLSPCLRYKALIAATGLVVLLLAYTVYIYGYTNRATVINGILAPDKWYQTHWVHLGLLAVSVASFLIYAKQRNVMRSHKHLSVNS